MKKFLHRLTGLVIVLLPLVGGGLIIYGNGFNTSLRDTVCEFIQRSPMIGIAIGLVLLLIGLVYLGTFGRPRPRLRTISFESEGGTVSISVNAVCDFIRKLASEFEAVKDIDPKLRAEKDMVSIDLNLKVRTGTRVPELSTLLQERVRESIRDGLGIVDIREIKVNISEIVGKPPPPFVSSSMDEME